VPRPRISLYCYLLSVGAATRPVDDDTVIVPFRIHAGAVVWRCRPDFTGARQRGGADRQSDPPAARRILSVRQTAESPRPRTSCRRRGTAFSPRSTTGWVPGYRSSRIPRYRRRFTLVRAFFPSSNGRSKVAARRTAKVHRRCPFLADGDGQNGEAVARRGVERRAGRW